MAIIIKKRHVVQTRAPAPVVPDLTTAKAAPAQAPTKPLQAPAAVPDDRPIAQTCEEYLRAPYGTMQNPPPIQCRGCKYSAPFPCHGEDDMCARAFAVKMKANLVKTKRQEAAHEGL